MTYLYIFLIALSLSADCFAVSISAGSSNSKTTHLESFKTSLSFGIAQFLMTVLGWFSGSFLEKFVSAYDHWLAFGLLAFIGGGMIWESFRNRDEGKNIDISKGFILILMAVATSIDALAAGLSFAFTKIDIWLASSIVGVVALIVSLIGFRLGRGLSSVFGKRAKLIGGIILVIIGVRILIEHLL